MIQDVKFNFKGTSFKLTCVLTVAVFILGKPLRSESKVPPQHRPNGEARIPLVANILGVRVGFDTVEDLEKRLGRGLPVRGGHPHGGRIWTSRKNGYSIWVDGFDYNSNGRVIDRVSIYSGLGAEEKRAPLISISKKDLSLLGTVSLGMSKREVLERTRKLLPPPKVEANELTWRKTGLSRAYSSITYRNWDVQLSFAHDRLHEISISCT